MRSVHLLGEHSFIPECIRDGNTGFRAGAELLLALVDTADPAFPSVADALREMRASGVDLDESAVRIAVKIGKRRWDRREEMTPPSSAKAQTLSLATAAGAIVYYVRRGDLVKIGTTTDPVRRFMELMPDEILAFEPGSYPEESARHRKFDHIRVAREHFRPAPELLGHIAEVHALYGDPDPEWPTSASDWRSKFRECLPAPLSIETVTGPQALRRLGINNSTLRSWVHRRKIQPVGHDERGRALYYCDDLLLLRGGFRAKSFQVA